MEKTRTLASWQTPVVDALRHDALSKLAEVQRYESKLIMVPGDR